MRMRHKPYARPELAAWPYSVDDPAALAGKWSTAFANPALPLRLEFGCGKGGFLARLALRDAHCNFLGVDIKSEVLVVAKRNIERIYAEEGRPLGNVLITSYDIERVNEVVSPADAPDRLYINFCNPWYKTGHAKHRLTHPRQLALYRDFLTDDAEIWFKTDDDPLFNDSLRYFPMAGYEVLWHTRDLHKNEPDWNIRTEHEGMFSAEGIPIKALIAKKRPAVLDREAIRRLRDC